MDIARLKKRPSYPFETIAVAFKFDESMEALISEAVRVSAKVGAKLILIHVGEKTDAKQNALDEIIDSYKVDLRNVRTCWAEGDTVESILEISKLNVVDLLILGASKKTNLFNYYAGSLARKISRKAKCSVILLTRPAKTESVPFKFVVKKAHHPKTIHTINTAFYLAGFYPVESFTFVADHDIKKQTTLVEKEDLMLTAKYFEDVNNRFSKSGLIKIHTKLLSGKKDDTFSNFAEHANADLMVINSPDHDSNFFDKLFSRDIEEVLGELPCSLLIVHSRV